MGLTDAVNATNVTGDLLEKVATNLTAKQNVTDTGIAAAQSFVPLIFSRLWALISAPFHHTEMLWIIFPLFFTFLVMEFYYDRNNDEELGWGAALANSLVLIFVAIDLVKVSFDYATPWSVLKTIMLAVFTEATLPLAPQVLLLVLFLGALGIAVTVINYFHLLPRKVAFVVSGHPPINFLAYFAIAIVYSTHSAHPIPFDLATLIAGALLFILLLVAVFGLKKFFSGVGSYGNNRNSIWGR